MVDDTAVTEGALASENVVVVTDVLAAESAAASETWSFIFYPGGVVSEYAVASDLWTLGSAALNASLAESAVARDGWAVSVSAGVSDSAAATEAWTLSVQNQISETARASAAITVSAAYNLAQASLATATEGWTFEHTRSLSDSAQASEGWTLSYVGGVQINETAYATETLTPKRNLNITLVETAEASVTLSPIMAYSVTMVERAQVSDWTSPGNDFTTYAINTRTQFISEYTNFNFNSVAQIGRLFVAADEDGLYELNGPTDLGADIIGRLGSGFFAPNGNKLAGFKAVYLSARGQGQYLLKVEASDGREWVYGATLNPNLMVTKINTGKGLKASMYRWELIAADGQDFDLNNIEFVPAMSGRRV